MWKYGRLVLLVCILLVVAFCCYRTEYCTELVVGLLEISWPWLKPLFSCLGSFSDFLWRLYAWSNRSNGFLTMLATVVIAIFTALLWEETKLSRLNKALLESLSLLREKQQLYSDCLEAKKSFMQVSAHLGKGPALVNFTHYCEFFENKFEKRAKTAGVIFPKGIRDQIEELSTSVKSFCIKDKQKSEKPQEWTDNQENEYSALRLEVSKGLDKVVNAIKEHIQAQIDGKEQTSGDAN